MSTHHLPGSWLVAGMFVAVTVCAAGLAACGGSTPPPTPTVTVTASSTSSPSVIASQTGSPTPPATTAAIAAAVGLKSDTLALIDPSGGQTVLVPGDGHIVTDVQISPGGRYIAYTKLTAHNLHSLAPRTLMVYDIVAGRSKPVSFGAISPATVGGHTWISPTEFVVVAYSIMPKNATTNGTLCRCDVTTWTATALKDASGAILKGDAPSASADGASLAFITYSNYKPPVFNASDVYSYGGSVTETLRVFHATGGSVTFVATASRWLDVEGSPFGRATISPDGSKIFTQQTGSDIGFGVTIYNTDGSKPKRFGFGRFQLPGGGAWDPNGSGEFVFVGSMMKHGFTSGLLLYGQGVTQIFETRRLMLRDVVWSPDGAPLAFTAFSMTAETQKAPDLWEIGVDGTGLHLLAKHASSPSWGTVVAP